MERWRGLAAVPADWGRSVVTIGVFDGVHVGHRLIIDTAVDQARAAGLASVVMTFDPHPSEVVRPGTHPPQLTTVRYKSELVAGLGADHLVVVPFTKELSEQPPDRFVHEVLVEGLHAGAVVVGENFRFGHRAAGDVALLTELGHRLGFSVTGVPLLHSEGDTVWSSTVIRTLVAAGDMRAAAAGLVRDHRVEGVVVRGEQRGRELGFPTANVAATPFAAIPADGVYAGRLVRWSDSKPVRLPAAISVGTNPTFQGKVRTVEAFVLDFSGDLYGESVGVEFVERLRGMVAYSGVEPLVAQMNLDVDRTRELLT